MKPLHHLLIISLRNAVIVIAAFTMYDLIETLKTDWSKKYPDSKHLHPHIGRVYHLISIFVAEFVIGLIVYLIFHIVH
jgi:hypothetical protein